MDANTRITQPAVMTRTQLDEDVISSVGQIGPDGFAPCCWRLLQCSGRGKARPDQEEKTESCHQAFDQRIPSRSEAPIDMRARAP